MPAGFPSVIPAGPPLSFPPVVSGNPASCFVVLSFVWPCMGKAMDSRLKTSGMTEGELKASGMTECLLCLFVMPARPLCHSRQSSLSFPPAPSVMPAGPPLSFPPVVSGNPASCFVVLLFVWPLHGRSHGFPIKNVGNDRRGIEHGGHDGMSALPLCHARWAPSVMPAGFPDNKCRGQG